MKTSSVCIGASILCAFLVVFLGVLAGNEAYHDLHSDDPSADATKHNEPGMSMTAYRAQMQDIRKITNEIKNAWDEIKKNDGRRRNQAGSMTIQTNLVEMEALNEGIAKMVASTNADDEESLTEALKKGILGAAFVLNDGDVFDGEDFIACISKDCNANTFNRDGTPAEKNCADPRRICGDAFKGQYSFQTFEFPGNMEQLVVDSAIASGSTINDFVKNCSGTTIRCTDSSVRVDSALADKMLIKKEQWQKPKGELADHVHQCTATGTTIMIGYDFEGKGDLEGNPLLTKTVEECDEACRKTIKCTHFSFSEKFGCFLKDLGDEAFPDSNFRANFTAGHVNRDTMKKISDHQKKWDEFSTAMGFPYREGGDKIVPVKAQAHLTGLSDTCAAAHGKKITMDCLGPLARLIGTWQGEHGKVFTVLPRHKLSNGVNNGLMKNFTEWQGFTQAEFDAGLTTSPEKPTANFANIKTQTYAERITFEPIMGTVRNRGYSEVDQINPQCDGDQILTGVSYRIQVKQTSRDDKDGSPGDLIHEEVGMFMFNAVPSIVDDYTVSRMGVVPHGITVVTEGGYGQFNKENVDEFKPTEKPFFAFDKGDLDVDKGDVGGKLRASQLKYLNQFGGVTDSTQPIGSTKPKNTGLFPGDNCAPLLFNPANSDNFGKRLNSGGEFEDVPKDWGKNNVRKFLTEQTDSFKDRVISFIEMELTKPNAGDNFAQMSFVKQQPNIFSFDNKWWISEVGNEMKLQYTQKSAWRFMHDQSKLTCEGAPGAGESQPKFSDNDNVPINCQATCAGMEKDFVPPVFQSDLAESRKNAAFTVLNAAGVEYEQNTPTQKVLTSLLMPFSYPPIIPNVTSLGKVGGPTNDIPQLQQSACYKCLFSSEDDSDVELKKQLDNLLEKFNKGEPDFDLHEEIGKLSKENIKRGNSKVLQTDLIGWPHVQLNTLTKISDTAIGFESFKVAQAQFFDLDDNDDDELDTSDLNCFKRGTCASLKFDSG